MMMLFLKDEVRAVLHQLSQSNGLCDACMPTNSLCVVNVVFVFVFVFVFVCLRESE